MTIDWWRLIGFMVYTQHQISYFSAGISVRDPASVVLAPLISLPSTNPNIPPTCTLINHIPVWLDNRHPFSYQLTKNLSDHPIASLSHFVRKIFQITQWGSIQKCSEKNYLMTRCHTHSLAPDNSIKIPHQNEFQNSTHWTPFHKPNPTPILSPHQNSFHLPHPYFILYMGYTRPPLVDTQVILYLSSRLYPNSVFSPRWSHASSNFQEIRRDSYPSNSYILSFSTKYIHNLSLII